MSEEKKSETPLTSPALSKMVKINPIIRYKIDKATGAPKPAALLTSRALPEPSGSDSENKLDHNELDKINSSISNKIKEAIETTSTVSKSGKATYRATGIVTVDDLKELIKPPYTPKDIFNFNNSDCLHWLKEAIRMHSRPWLNEGKRKNWYEIVEYFLQYVEDINNINLSLPPVFLITSYLDPILFKLFIKHGADVTKMVSHKDTVLHWLALKDEKKSRKIMDLVFEALKAKNKLTEIINRQNHGGDTALWKAAESRSWKNVSLLLDSGADPNIAESALGRTPLHQATLINNLMIVKILVVYDADILKEDQCHTAMGAKSPKQIAEDKGFKEINDFFAQWEKMTEEERGDEGERIKKDCRKKLHKEMEESKAFGPPLQIRSPEASKTFDPEQPQTLYFLVKQKLDELASYALPESHAGENQVIDYMQKKLRASTNITVANHAWNLDAEDTEDAKIYAGNTAFPIVEYLDFLADPKKTKFVIPICIKASHFCGFIVNKETNCITYFNPTSNGSTPNSEDKEVYEKIKQLFKTKLSQFINKIKQTPNNASFADGTIQLSAEQVAMIKTLSPQSYENVPEIANVSSKQQINGCDCGYVVGQTCVDLASSSKFSIPSFDPQNPEESARTIAQARTNFVDPELVGQEKSENTCFDQWTLRLAKALCENSSWAEEARELPQFIKNTKLTHAINKYHCYRDLFDLVKTCVEKLDEIDKLKQQHPKETSSLNLENKIRNILPHGDTITESIQQYLLGECKQRKISLDQLKTFCDNLLTTRKFKKGEEGDVIFILNPGLLQEDASPSSKTIALNNSPIFSEPPKSKGTSANELTDHHSNDFKSFAP